MANAKIIRGQDKTLTPVKIRLANGDPYDLAGNTEISACFLNANGTTLTVTLGAAAIIVNGIDALGSISITLTDAETALLALGENQTFHVLVDVGAHPGGTRTAIEFKQVLDVIEAIC
jgi:hypothetical protein